MIRRTGLDGKLSSVPARRPLARPALPPAPAAALAGRPPPWRRGGPACTGDGGRASGTAGRRRPRPAEPAWHRHRDAVPLFRVGRGRGAAEAGLVRLGHRGVIPGDRPHARGNLRGDQHGHADRRPSGDGAGISTARITLQSKPANSPHRTVEPALPRPGAVHDRVGQLRHAPARPLATLLPGHAPRNREPARPGAIGRKLPKAADRAMAAPWRSTADRGEPTRTPSRCFPKAEVSRSKPDGPAVFPGGRACSGFAHATERLRGGAAPSAFPRCRGGPVPGSREGRRERAGPRRSPSVRARSAAPCGRRSAPAPS